MAESEIGTGIAFQNRILPQVSRTFALTIPRLPPRLAVVVANAYLLCRIADTIEDDEQLAAGDKLHFAAWFCRVVERRAPAQEFAARLEGALAPQTPAAERELIGRTALVTAVTRSFSHNETAAIARTIRVMTTGMSAFQQCAGTHGLADLATMNSYCYHVAGVVGELLTTLFCEYSGAIAERRDDLQRVAYSFGQGLQMTNILKDVWEDRRRGACWLPQDVLLRHGVDLKRAPGLMPDARLHGAIRELVAIATRHLHGALLYARAIPRHEKGIRAFCLWPIGMAMLTLWKISQQPNFSAAHEVKISRRSVRLSGLVTTLSARSNLMLDLMFGSMERFLAWLPPHAAAHRT